MIIHKSILLLFFLIFCLATQGLAQEKSTDGQEKQAYIEDYGKSADEMDALHITQHFVDAVKQYGNAYLMQGRGA